MLLVEEVEKLYCRGFLDSGTICACVFDLTSDVISVVVLSAQEVRHCHQQRRQARQQSSASNEPRPMDSTPKKTHKDDEDRVPHLGAQTKVLL